MWEDQAESREFSCKFNLLPCLLDVWMDSAGLTTPSSLFGVYLPGLYSNSFSFSFHMLYVPLFPGIVFQGKRCFICLMCLSMKDIVKLSY